MAISPTVEGFRAALRRPSLTLAEMMWRWTAGATAAVLCVFGLFEYLDTLPVTNGELLFLRTRHPYLVAEAIAHILRGSLNRAVMAGLFAAMMLMVLWIVAASLGRTATVRVLLDYFRRDAGIVATGGVPDDGERDVASNVSTIVRYCRRYSVSTSCARPWRWPPGSDSWARRFWLGSHRRTRILGPAWLSYFLCRWRD